MGLYDRSLVYSYQVETALRRGGASYVVCCVAKKVFCPFCHAGYVMFFGRDLANYSRTAPNAPSIRLTLLTERDVSLLAFSRPDDPRVVERAIERFNKGDQCFVALTSNNDVAHSRWVSGKDSYIPELQMNTRPHPKQAYMYDGYSKPEYRGHGIDGSIRNFIFETLKSQGVESVYSYVRSDNPVGIRAAARWQTPLGRVWYLRLRDADPFVFGLRQTRLPTLLRP